MTDKIILKKAIKKAQGNGWNDKYGYLDIAKGNNMFEVIIFNHDFAKAFWKGDAKITAHWKASHLDNKCGSKKQITRWQFHLQQLVLEKEPLKYLEKFL